MKRSLQSLIACSLLGRVAHASDLRVPEEKARAGVAASDRLASSFRCPVTRPLCLSTVSFPWLSVQCLCGLITRRGRTDRQCDVPCFWPVSGSGGYPPAGSSPGGPRRLPGGPSRAGEFRICKDVLAPYPRPTPSATCQGGASGVLTSTRKASPAQLRGFHGLVQ